MASLNKISIIGNLGRDPECRYSADGKAVCTFSVAVTEKNKDGERTEWFRVKCFGKTAENAAQYLARGRQVYAEGRLELNKYKDKDGVDRTSLEIMANQIVFLGAASDSAPSPTRAPSARDPSPPQAFNDDSMPF